MLQCCCWSVGVGVAGWSVGVLAFLCSGVGVGVGVLLVVVFVRVLLLSPLLECCRCWSCFSIVVVPLVLWLLVQCCSVTCCLSKNREANP